MTEKMDNFTDDASPKAGVPTGSGAVGRLVRTSAGSWVDAANVISVQLTHRNEESFSGRFWWRKKTVTPTATVAVTMAQTKWNFWIRWSGPDSHELAQCFADEIGRAAGATPAMKVGTPAQDDSPGDEAQGQKP